MEVIIYYILPFGITTLILFYVMKAAVKSALDDIRVQKNKELRSEADKEEFKELKALRDLEMLSGTELEEAIVLYKNDKAIKDNSEQYMGHMKTLDDLKEKGYFSDKQYKDKINDLKKHFNVD
jgi:hypothetical protein